jgi:hypothetical protein
MKLLILLTADHAYVDNSTGKLYVLGAFNQIGAREFPTRHTKLALVTRITSEITDFTSDQLFTVILVDEDGQEILKFEAPIAMPIRKDGNRPHLDTILEIAGILFPEAGAYEFRVSVGDELLGTTPIDIVEIGQ